MDLAARIEKQATLITVLGTALFVWFVFESVHFVYSGQLMDLMRTLPRFFGSSSLLGIYIVFHVIMSTFGAFVAIPLIRKGRLGGLVLGIAYSLSGNTMAPLSFVLPARLLLLPSNEPTLLSQGIDVLWLIVSLAVLLLYFFLMRQRSSD